MAVWSIRPKIERDCPACGHTFGSVSDAGCCPRCKHTFRTSPTHIALAGKLGKCDSSGILAAIAAYHGAPYLSSLDVPVCEVTARKIPEDVARIFCVIPVIFEGEIRFVIPDPMTPELTGLLSKLTDMAPKFAVASAAQILTRINDYYGVVDDDSAER